jgi:Spirocyclase AveC-like
MTTVDNPRFLTDARGNLSDPEVAKRPRPVLYAATVGVLLLAFELAVLGRWVLGSHFTTTPTGPDQISSATQALYTTLQIVVTALLAPCLWFWVIRPWRREGRLTTNGMFALSGGLLFFWDMVMNYTSVTLFYNSNLVNFGAWANGSWPGWTSPHGNLLPEPVFIVMPAYTTLVFVQVIGVLWVLRRVLTRWPRLGAFGQAVTIIVGLTITDTIVEGSVLRTGLYAYPGGIRSLTLFAGHTYQVPMTETFFFGGLGLGSIAMLMHFRDDHGRTIVERGLDRINVGARRTQLIKFCAIFGAVHLAFLVLYAVPCQWLATHSDPFPRGYKSYMVNGMCASGASHRLCPGPGIPMPRP